MAQGYGFDKALLPNIVGRGANVVEYNIISNTGAMLAGVETNIIDWTVPIGECVELLSLKIFAPTNLQRTVVRDINNREWNTFSTQITQELNTLPFWNPFNFPKKYTLKLPEGDHLKIYVQPGAGATPAAPLTYGTAVVRRYKAGSVAPEVYKNFDKYQGGMQSRAQYYEQLNFDLTTTVSNAWTDIITLDVTKNEAYYIYSAGISPVANLGLARLVIDDQIEYNQYTCTNTDGANELPFVETVKLDISHVVGATGAINPEYLKKMQIFNPVIKVVKNLNKNMKLQLRENGGGRATHAAARIIGVKRVLI
jgi:hypothetical protein